MSDPYSLSRFLEAQEAAYPAALAELENGQKATHWMWFVFPQIFGLGRSSVAVRYAISGLPEARAYLEHPVLGKRLRSCCEILSGLQGCSAEAIFGPVDAMKLRSSLTLFDQASGERIFKELLQQYYDGQPDQATLELIARALADGPGLKR